MPQERAEETLGPRPTGPNLDPASQLSRARAAVLERLGMHPRPTTAGALAAECGQHPNTVREHLDALVAAGLVVRSSGTARGRGRPAIHYSAVPPEMSRPQMREYVELVTALAEQIEDDVTDVRAFAEEAGRRMGRRAQHGRVEGQDATDVGLDLLRVLGFDPEVVDPGLAGHPMTDAAGLVVDLRRCPLLEAARRHPAVVCSAHLGAIQGVYEGLAQPSAGVRLVPFARPGACVTVLPFVDASPV